MALDYEKIFGEKVYLKNMGNVNLLFNRFLYRFYITRQASKILSKEMKEAVMYHELKHKHDNWIFFLGTFLLFIGYFFLNLYLSGGLTYWSFFVLLIFSYLVPFQWFLEFRADDHAKKNGKGKMLAEFLDKYSARKMKLSNIILYIQHPPVKLRIDRLLGKKSL